MTLQDYLTQDMVELSNRHIEELYTNYLTTGVYENDGFWGETEDLLWLGFLDYEIYQGSPCAIINEKGKNTLFNWGYTLVLDL